MTRQSPPTPDAKLQSIIKLAILAVGGQGGGVLTSWIEHLARAQGYAAQATSVAGVAQRTGATIYYIEMAPQGPHTPVFSLAPTSGDVDIMIAAEMMEAGRAIMRGFVTPDRTTLIASTHRALAVSEKMAPGDGIASSDEVRAAAQLAADQLVMFNMDKLALANGSVISSALFGALAGSGALPFPRAAFEDAIRASGKGVTTSLRAFDAAYARAQTGAEDAPPEPPAERVVTATGPAALREAWDALIREADQLPAPDMVRAGLQKAVAFQDLDYGRDYLARLRPWAEADRGDGRLMEAAAKHIANAMAYDDVIRVADRKTRPARFDRIRAEMKAGDSPVRLTEFLHPRGEEIIGLLPVKWGRWIEARPALAAWIDRCFNKGRRLRSHRITGFGALYALGWLRARRRGSLRHAQEVAHMERWLDQCRAALARDYDSAIELLTCRRLVKGYSDTHARTISKFDKVMAASSLLEGRADAAVWIARLRGAAMQDEDGTALEGAIKTIKSFTE